jgi:SAM-dependent methyltransferase
MEFREYEVMYRAESDHWWYRGLRSILFRQTGLDRPASRQWCILDAGCGTGGTLGALPQHRCTRGFDYAAAAIHFCRERGLQNVAQASILAMPFPDNTFDLVISNDVLSSLGDGKDGQGLREIYRVLKPGGRLFVNLPAYPFLRSEHDVAAWVEHRYTGPELRRKLHAAGFRIRRLSHWNLILFPIIVVVRLARRKGADLAAAEAHSDIRVPPLPINVALTTIIRVESFVLRYVDLPVGSSLIALAQKPGGRRAAPPPPIARGGTH